MPHWDIVRSVRRQELRFTALGSGSNLTLDPNRETTITIPHLDPCEKEGIVCDILASSVQVSGAE
jgi:hypothetical protein